MRYLQEFLIPYLGLKDGMHSYTYEVDEKFFKSLNEKELSGQFQVRISLDKRASMMILDFDIHGHFHAACDRCVADIEIPIENDFQQIVKFAEQEEDTSDVYYLDPAENHMDIRPFLYEHFRLSMPLKRVRDCESEDYKYCNTKALDALTNFETEKEENPIWDSLKNLNIKK